MKWASPARSRTMDFLTKYRDCIFIYFLEGSKIQKQNAHRGCGTSILWDTEHLTSRALLQRYFWKPVPQFYWMTHSKESCTVMIPCVLDFQHIPNWWNVFAIRQVLHLPLNNYFIRTDFLYNSSFVVCLTYVLQQHEKVLFFFPERGQDQMDIWVCS